MDEEQIARRSGVDVPTVRLLLIVRRNLIMAIGLLDDFVGRKRTIPLRKKRKARKWFEGDNGQPIRKAE